jgi:hypothetical protein
VFGISVLKPRLDAGASDVSCPVRGCGYRVPLQPGLFRTTAEYRCPLHRIYVAANTFAYEREADNLLWTREDDLVLLNGGRRSGWDLGLAYENSERAVTWNVFRWLEVSGVLPGLLEHVLGRSVATAQVIYWAYSPEREGIYMPIVRARNAFEEEGADAIEPAVLIDTDDMFILVDPRMGPGTEKSQTPVGWERYERGGKGWSSRVFAGAVRDVAAEKGPFGLLKLWLLGSYMAELAGKAFVLLHVTPAWSGAPLLAKLRPQLVSNPGREAISLTWEDTYEYVAGECADVRDAQAVLTYFREKSAGYGADGRLRRAFAVPPYRAG